MKRFVLIMATAAICLFAGLSAWKQPAPDLLPTLRGSVLVDFIKSSSAKVSTQASLSKCMLVIEEINTHGCPPGARYRSMLIEADLNSVSRVILRPFENQTYMIFAPKGSAVVVRQAALKCDGDTIEMKSPATLSILVDKNIELANADEMNQVINHCNDLPAQD